MLVDRVKQVLTCVMGTGARTAALVTGAADGIGRADTATIGDSSNASGVYTTRTLCLSGHRTESSVMRAAYGVLSWGIILLRTVHMVATFRRFETFNASAL
jgi:hypothetical protein